MANCTEVGPGEQHGARRFGMRTLQFGSIRYRPRMATASEQGLAISTLRDPSDMMECAFREPVVKRN
jgi:hypothetical protein